MKNPEINIIKKLSPEQKKLLFFAPLAIIIFVICGYVLFFDGKEKASDKITTSSNNWDLPTDKKEELPNSTLAIQDELDAFESKENKNNKDFFDGLTNSTESAPVKNDSQVSEDLDSKDAMYLKVQQQLQDLENKKQQGNKSYVTSSNNNSSSNTGATNAQNRTSQTVDVNENDVDVNDFFRNKVPTNTQNKTTTTEVLKTDTEVYAVVHSDHTIKSGDRITMRLTKDATINGTKYKANTFVYGMARFNQNRILINIENIDHNKVSLVAYDMQDGNQGLYVEGAVASEVTQQGANDAANDVDLNGVPLGNTVKNIFKRKNREAKVYLINDYAVLLKPNR